MQKLGRISAFVILMGSMWSCASVRLADRTPSPVAFVPAANIQQFVAQVRAPADHVIDGVTLERRGIMDIMSTLPTGHWAVRVAIPACDEVVSYRFIVTYSRTSATSASVRTKTFPASGTFTRSITDQPPECAAMPTVGRRSFAVGTFVDAVDAAPGDGNCATVAGECSLRAAIMESNALAGLNQIELPGGVYRLALTGSEAPDTPNAAVGDLDITDALVIRSAAPCSHSMSDLFNIPTPTDPFPTNRYEPRPDDAVPPNVVTIDAGGIDRVFDIYEGTGQETGVKMTCVQIRGGHVVGAEFASALPARGSGILNRSTLVLEQVVVANNRQTQNGEGIGIHNAGILVAHDSAIFGNRNEVAGEGFGGSSGGGLFNARGASATLERTLVAMNASARGAAIWNGGGVVPQATTGDAPSLTLTNVTVAFNVAHPGTVSTKTSIVNKGRATIGWSTVYDDNATAAIHNETGHLNVGSSIIAAAGDVCRSMAGVASYGGNFFSDSTCARPSTIDTITSSLVFVSALEMDGGFTPTLRLGMPEAGRPSAVDAAPGLLRCPEHDQRNRMRPFTGVDCDAGAFERSPGDR